MCPHPCLDCSYYTNKFICFLLTIQKLIVKKHNYDIMTYHFHKNKLSEIISNKTSSTKFVKASIEME